jgi:hypothetical protein
MLSTKKRQSLCKGSEKNNLQTFHYFEKVPYPKREHGILVDPFVIEAPGLKENL